MKAKKIEVDVAYNLHRLLKQEDLDHDFKITVEDRGPKSFLLEAINGQTYPVVGTYPLANLLQTLARAESEQKKQCVLFLDDLWINPVDHLSKQIRDIFWKDLTRRLDEKGLLQLLEDSKTERKEVHYLYVPDTDPKAFEYFEKVAKKHPFMNLKVLLLKQPYSLSLFKQLDEKPGILALKLDQNKQKGVPFVVPGGRFNEMYGWDSYFILLGLLQDKKWELAKGVVENCGYQIQHYGAILNANRTYYLSRSNPPFFTSMLRVLIERQKDCDLTSSWIEEHIELAIKEYESVWHHPNRLTPTGLNRYYGGELKAPIEVEKDHFDSIYEVYAQKHQMSTKAFEQAYSSGLIKEPKLDQYFVHDRAMRESGHDTTKRLVNRCAHLNSVDLNSLLYKTENDLAFLIKHFHPKATKSFSFFLQRAEKRKEKMLKLMWDEKTNLFYDYNFIENKRESYKSLTSIYPLFAHLVDSETGVLLIESILKHFECSGGLVATTKTARGQVNSKNPQRQWDYPFGWAPHQVLFWLGAENYGLEKPLRRVIYKWLYMITQEAVDYNGVIVEKYNVVEASHKVRAEYGNEGLDFQAYPKGGFGWVNASYQIGLKKLTSEELESLKKLKAPSWVFK